MTLKSHRQIGRSVGIGQSTVGDTLTSRPIGWRELADIARRRRTGAGVVSAQAVADRPNGATDVRRKGATSEC